MILGTILILLLLTISNSDATKTNDSSETIPDVSFLDPERQYNGRWKRRCVRRPRKRNWPPYAYQLCEPSQRILKAKNLATKPDFLYQDDYDEYDDENFCYCLRGYCCRIREFRYCCPYPWHEKSTTIRSLAPITQWTTTSMQKIITTPRYLSRVPFYAWVIMVIALTVVLAILYLGCDRIKLLKPISSRELESGSTTSEISLENVDSTHLNTLSLTVENPRGSSRSDLEAELEPLAELPPSYASLQRARSDPRASRWTLQRAATLPRTEPAVPTRSQRTVPLTIEIPSEGEIMDAVPEMESPTLPEENILPPSYESLLKS